jgi:hypothetical protein
VTDNCQDFQKDSSHTLGYCHLRSAVTLEHATGSQHSSPGAWRELEAAAIALVGSDATRACCASFIKVGMKLPSGSLTMTALSCQHHVKS